MIDYIYYMRIFNVIMCENVWFFFLHTDHILCCENKNLLDILRKKFFSDFFFLVCASVTVVYII